MTTDLDTLGRRAAADLLARTGTIDTEAALARFAAPGGGTARPSRRPGRALAVAAAVTLVALAAGAVAVRGGGDREARLSTDPAVPVDPDDYGPVVATVRGNSPTLQVDLHRPARLDDGTEVAVAIHGGVAGQRYSVIQCASGADDYNPAADCTLRPDIVLGPNGSGTAVVVAWSVMEGMGAPHRSDCRLVACELQVSAVVDDADPTTEDPDRGFGTPALPGAGLALVFAPDASAPPLPTIAVEAVGSAVDGLTVRITGTDLAPGTTPVLLDAFPVPRTGMLSNLFGIGPVEVATVDVGPDGTVDQEVVLPPEVTEQGQRTIGDVVQEPVVVRCDDDQGRCTVRLGLPRTDPSTDLVVERRLVPEQVPYPTTR